MFAIHEINSSPRLLLNITLGFHLYNNLFNSKITSESILDFLFTQEKERLNYKCDKKNVLSVVGGITKEMSIDMANVLGIYKIPQVFVRCMY